MSSIAVDLGAVLGPIVGKEQLLLGSDLGDDHKTFFAGDKALKAGGAKNTSNQFEPVLELA